MLATALDSSVLDIVGAEVGEGDMCHLLDIRLVAMGNFRQDIREEE